MSQRLSGLIAALVVSCLAVSQLQAGEELVGFTKIGPFTMLVGFDSDAPMVPNYVKTLVGLKLGEKIVDLDYHPSDGYVYALATTSSSSKRGQSSIYAINLSTGQMVQVLSKLNPDLAKSSNTLFGIDFNPMTNDLAVVSTEDQYIVVDALTGQQTAHDALFYDDGDANFGTNPNLGSLAYDNNVFGATSSQGYGIDLNLNILAKLDSNTSALTTVGSLGNPLPALGGFDISASGTAYVLATTATTASPTQNLYVIDLQTGALSQGRPAAFGILNLKGLTVYSAGQTTVTGQ